MGPQPAKVIPTLTNAPLRGFLSRFAHIHPIYRCSRLARIQRPEGPSGTATAPPQDFGRSVALPGATAWLIPGYLCPEQAGEGMGFGGMAKAWCWTVKLWEVWCLICQDLMTVV